MALIRSTTITAAGSTTIQLFNKRGKDRNIYSVALSGTFGGGTVTAFLRCDGANTIAIKDNSGVAISLTAADVFNFEMNSDATNPVALIITLTGGSAQSINLRVYDNK